jgi:hypothetical protein
MEMEEGVMGRTTAAMRRTLARWRAQEDEAAPDAARGRPLESMDDWILFGPRLR